jgi:hypothetical protein
MDAWNLAGRGQGIGCVPIVSRIAGLALAAISLQAGAFGSDLCFTDSNQFIDCIPLPPGCAPGDDSSDCLAAFSTLAAQQSAQTAKTGGQRSLVHMDTTYYLAQYVGFTPDQAYTIAAYSEALDVSQYVPRDKNGVLLADPDQCASTPGGSNCSLITQPLDGLNRSNLITGGVFFHFDSPYSGTRPQPVAGLNGLDPNADAPSPELLLDHVKRWADPASGSNLLCAHGVTARSSRGDYATGSTCYAPNAGKQIHGSMAVVETSDQTTAPFTFDVPTGLQIISTPLNGGPTISSDSFDAYVGNMARYARIGVYLHAYQDRISHHRCLDVSTLSGATAGKNAFEALLDDTACVQGEHIIRHGWEVGVDQAGLDSQDQTMSAAVSGSYDELLSLATDMGIANSRAGNSANRQNVINAFVAVLQTPEPQTRAMNVTATGLNYGLQALPGY